MYEILRVLAQIALRWFYSEIRVVGLQHLPDEGPVLLAANHPNALVDALVIGRVIRRPITLTAKATLFENPVAALFFRSVGIIPLRRASDEAVVAGQTNRNEAAFESIFRRLERGHVVLIFPEGKSHNDPSLAPLRTGLARIALRAVESGRVKDLKIVPIGLTFEQKERPRSRIVVTLGSPVDLRPSLAEDEVTQVQILTQAIDAALRAVTLNFASHEVARETQLITRILTAAPASPAQLGAPSSFQAEVDLAHRVEAVRRHVPMALGDDDTLRQLRERMRLFANELQAERLEAEDLNVDLSTSSAAKFVLREGVLAILSAPVVWLGRIVHFLPLRAARLVAFRLSKSLEDPAMHTIVFGVAFVLLSYLLQLGVVWIVLGPWPAGFLLLLLPVFGTLDVVYTDRWRRARGRIRTFLALRRNPELREKLLREALDIRSEAARIEHKVLLTNR